MTQPRTNAPQPRFIRYTTLEQVGQDIRELYRLMQPKTFRVVKVAPIATDLNEGEIVFLDDESSARKIYVKLNGTLRSGTLT